MLISEEESEIEHFVFFFFKQKTAYEMRISDWSSDVCSSDLQQRADEEGADGGGKAALDGTGRGEQRGARRRPGDGDRQARLQGEVDAAEPHRSEERSCRERVCKYV